MVSVLLEAHTEVDKALKDGSTPLLIAATSGHAAVVSALLRAGADLTAAAKDGSTALLEATSNGHEAAVLALLAGNAAKAADACQAMDEEGCTPLLEAVSRGYAGIVMALLRAGADAHQTFGDELEGYYTPQSAAEDHGHEAVIAMLHSWTLTRDDPVGRYYLQFSSLPTSLPIVDSPGCPLDSLPAEVMSMILTKPPSCRHLSHRVRRFVLCMFPNVLRPRKKKKVRPRGTLVHVCTQAACVCCAHN